VISRIYFIVLCIFTITTVGAFISGECRNEEKTATLLDTAICIGEDKIMAVGNPSICTGGEQLRALSTSSTGSGGERLTELVDPFIGTGGHGHTYPGATVPFGMVQLSPDTRLTGWDGCSGYHYSDSLVYGFSHTHLSGTGCSDYGDILVVATTGKVLLRNGAGEGNTGYRSHFSHQDEKARPGFYSVLLRDYGITAELTVSPRCGFHRYTFPAGRNSNIIIDLTHRDQVIESGIRFVGERRIEGFRRSSAWARDQRVFFAAELSRTPSKKGVASGDTMEDGKSMIRGQDIRAFLTFETDKGEEILLKIALSPVSMEGARRNLQSEIPDWDFEETVSRADDIWEEALSRIIIVGGTNEQRITFYTALYHTLICPNLFTDVDGRYRGMDMEIHKTKGYTHYTVFSLWDTYRALHPLFTIIEQKRTADLINTLINDYRQGGRLPVWELAANETDCMIGYHSVPVIADAYIKGIRGFDAGKALEAMKSSASLDTFGLKHYRKHGYIPSDMEGESVSKTLEYSYDDWCIAHMAKEMDCEKDYRKYIKRGQYYKNLFDPVTGFMRTRKNGGGVTPFDPAEVNFNYTEANSWQYSFYVPQDIHGLIALSGGPAAFEEKLDSLFTTDSETSGLGLPDVSGLIGQYAHGNEPSHHMAYLYDYIGRQHKTQARVREIMDTMYSARPDGLCGNEDCGQMSAWYIFSALGFYPVTPGSDLYPLGSPLFERAMVSLENGRKFVVIAEGNSQETPYVTNVMLNGKDLEDPFIRHSDIMEGGELVFEISSEPAINDQPSWTAGNYSRITDHPIIPSPWFSPADRTFRKPMHVKLLCMDEEAKIYYTTFYTTGIPAKQSRNASKTLLYTEPIEIKHNTTITAHAEKDGISSFPVTAKFTRIPENLDIELRTKYSSMYSASGDFALIDGVRGANNFRTGTWQGYQGVDLDAVVDLGSVKKIGRISIGFLQDQKSWIFLPEEVKFFVSEDGSDFTLVATLHHNIPPRKEGSVIKEFSADDLDLIARYIRVMGKNMGTCPAWHRGAGHRAWVFADEITVE
jgi:predicted alpha-1,2-mannosidase